MGPWRLVNGCLGLRGRWWSAVGADLRLMRSSPQALVPLSQQFEGVNARVVSVVPGDVEPPGTVQFGALDTKRYRAVRAGPAVFSPLTHVAARRTRASLTQAQQVELSDVAVVERDRHPDLLGDVDGLGLMTFVHAAALQVRRGRSDDHRHDRVPVTAGLAPHRHEVVDAEDRSNPSPANTASANGTPTAASGLVTSSLSGSVVSNVNFIASGFGVGEGEAFAMRRA